MLLQCQCKRQNFQQKEAKPKTNVSAVTEADLFAFLDDNISGKNQDSSTTEDAESRINSLNETIKTWEEKNKNLMQIVNKLRNKLNEMKNKVQFFMNECSEARSSKQQFENLFANADGENKRFKETIKILQDDKMRRDPLMKALTDKVTALEEQIATLGASLAKSHKEVSRSIMAEKRTERLLREANANLRKMEPTTDKNKSLIDQLREENSEKEHKIQLLMANEKRALELLNKVNLQNNSKLKNKEPHINGKLPVQLQKVNAECNRKIQEITASEKKARENEKRLEQLLNDAHREIREQRAFIDLRESRIKQLKDEKMEQDREIQRLTCLNEVPKKKHSVIIPDFVVPEYPLTESVFKSEKFGIDPSNVLKFREGLLRDLYNMSYSCPISPFPEDQVLSLTGALDGQETCPDTFVEDRVSSIQHKTHGENEITSSAAKTFGLNNVPFIQPKTFNKEKVPCTTQLKTCDKNEAASIQHEHFDRSVVTSTSLKKFPEVKFGSTSSELSTEIAPSALTEKFPNVKLLKSTSQIDSCLSLENSSPIQKEHQSLNSEAIGIEAEDGVAVFNANGDGKEIEPFVAWGVAQREGINKTPVKGVHEAKTKSLTAIISRKSSFHLDDLDKLFSHKEERPSFGKFASKICKIPQLGHSNELNSSPVLPGKSKGCDVPSVRVQNLEHALKRKYPSKVYHDPMTSHVNKAKRQSLELEELLVTEQQQSNCNEQTLKPCELKKATIAKTDSCCENICSPLKGINIEGDLEVQNLAKTDDEHIGLQCTEKEKPVPNVKPLMETSCNSELLGGVLKPPPSHRTLKQVITSIPNDYPKKCDSLPTPLRQSDSGVRYGNSSEVIPHKMVKSKQKTKASYAKPQKKQKSKIPRTAINIHSYRPSEHPLESALDELEQMKFQRSRSDYSQFKRHFINALKNPAVVQSSEEIVACVCQRLAASTRDPFSSFIKGGKDMDFLLPRIECCIVESIYDIYMKEKHRFPTLLTKLMKEVANCILHDESLSLRGITAFCRVFGILCKYMINATLEAKVDIVWGLLDHLKKHRDTVFPFAAASVLCVWPIAWETRGKHELDRKIILELMLKPPHVLAEQEIKNSWAVCLKTIKVLFEKEIPMIANKSDCQLSTALGEINDSHNILPGNMLNNILTDNAVDMSRKNGGIQLPENNSDTDHDESDSLKENEIHDCPCRTESFRKEAKSSTLPP